MGAPILKPRLLHYSRRGRKSKTEWRAGAIILASVGLPVIVAGGLAALIAQRDMRNDLSELEPLPGTISRTPPLIGWRNLDPRDDHPAQTRIRISVGTPVRMLGYMMDGDKPSPDGTSVTVFTLMPEAGHFLHPARRIPEEMVEVWLKQPALFKLRSLIWVSGALEHSSVLTATDQPLYAIRDASVEPAADADITKWLGL